PSPPPSRPVPDAPRFPSIYVARPADDMRQPHDRIVNELRNRGFGTVPETDVPNDETAAKFIDDALAKAALSIHPLGEKRGFAPPEEEPIVKLQLARAANRARQLALLRDEQGPSFHRIVWAPKILEEPTSPSSTEASERDPFSVFEKFGERLD